MYPRHFGLIMSGKEAYDNLETVWKGHKGSGYIYEKIFNRNEGKFHEHRTFFLNDPSNNLIEIKAYKNDEAIFSDRLL